MVVLSMLLLRARLPLCASDRLVLRGDGRPLLGALSSCAPWELLLGRLNGVAMEGNRLIWPPLLLNGGSCSWPLLLGGRCSVLWLDESRPLRVAACP
jgi:hypothetical protein